MYRLTTPLHEFGLPFDTENIKNLVVSFGQNESEVLSKRIEDCMLEGNVVKVKLTQEETKLFTPHIPVNIQLRVLTKHNEALTTCEYKVKCEDVINDEVLV